MISSSQIADGVVEMLNSLTTDITFTAEKPDLLPEIDREDVTETVHVYPWEETEESKTGTDDCLLIVRTVNVMVQSPIGKRTLAEFLAWVNQIKEGFRAHVIDFGENGSFRWDKNESAGLYDFDALKDKQQFLSQFRATYFQFG